MNPVLVDNLANWKQEAPGWGAGPDIYLTYGVEALETGHPSLSYEILSAGLILNPGHPELTYRAALALARCHSINKSAELISELLEILAESDPVTADSLSLAGRLAKDRWTIAEDPEEKSRHATQSAASYRKAYRLSNSYYPGINAATMSILAGDVTNGNQLAGQIKQQCLDILSGENIEDYWLAATLGEACLLLNQQGEAADWYRRAADLVQDSYGDLAAIRRQVKLLANTIPVTDGIIEILKVPGVVVFTGSMIDAPDRETPRFPPGLEISVKEAIEKSLDNLNAEIGYCSAACGSDILFIEAMLNRGAEVQVVLPFKKEDFEKTSVLFAGDEWRKRFENILGRVKQVHYAIEEGYLNDNILFEYCTSLMFGMAGLRARQLETEPDLLAVYEIGDRLLPGGTAENVSRWKELGYQTKIIDLSDLKTQNTINDQVKGRATGQDTDAIDNTETSLAHSISREVKAMLFADVVGFSKLDEEMAPNFFVNFLSEVSNIIQSRSIKPAFCNTWGDGLFLVYDHVEAAADVALHLRDMIQGKDWQEVGLPEGTTIRIGIHAGPVYSAVDPMINKVNYYGTHVNRAARIEPVAAPGSIFISEQMACLLSLSKHHDFMCDYLGPIELAKAYSTNVLYRLRRKGEVE